jgi:hypothetical protein
MNGIGLAFMAAQLDTPGLISAFYAVGLSAMGGSMAQWRTERGLWMLAGLFLLVWGAIYGISLYGEFQDFVRGAPMGVGLLIDVTVATAILSTKLRFLWRVAQYNWRFSRQPGVDRFSAG